jgi:hypothetical protein
MRLMAYKHAPHALLEATCSYCAEYATVSFQQTFRILLDIAILLTLSSPSLSLLTVNIFSIPSYRTSHLASIKYN